MLLQVGLFVVGLVILTAGGEFLVRGSSKLAEAMGISPFIIGATIVAYGTSAPELMVSAIASWQGAASIALGNVVGSNLFNTGLILGIAALISPLYIQRDMIKIEMPFNMGFNILITGLSFLAVIARWHGAVLLILFAGYIFLAIRKEMTDRKTRKEERNPDEPKMSAGQIVLNVVFILLGLVGLFGGAKLMVDAAIIIAREFGISERVIGLTIVALGTSLPELATAVVAALKKHSELVLGNLLGSNIFNLGLILGTASIIRPIPLQGQTSLIDFGFLLVNGIMLMIFLRTGEKIARWEGGILLAFYGLFFATLFI